MKGVNKVILLGTVGKDPKIHYIDNGLVYARFSLATDEVHYNKHDEKIKTTEWHQIVLWRKQAEMAEEYIHKGSRLYIEGKLRNRSWDDAEGHQNYRTEVHGTSVVLLDKSSNKDENEIKKEVKPEYDTNIKEADELPF